jgi:hypothetical protein
LPTIDSAAAKDSTTTLPTVQAAALAARSKAAVAGPADSLAYAVAAADCSLIRDGVVHKLPLVEVLLFLPFQDR